MALHQALATKNGSEQATANPSVPVVMIEELLALFIKGCDDASLAAVFVFDGVGHPMKKHAEEERRRDRRLAAAEKLRLLMSEEGGGPDDASERTKQRKLAVVVREEHVAQPKAFSTIRTSSSCVLPSRQSGCWPRWPSLGMWLELSGKTQTTHLLA